MGDSFADAKYILALNDHATHFCELVITDTADSNVTVEALLARNTRFGLTPSSVSDQGSHLKNEVMKELSRRLRSKHRFIPAYRSWIN
ncbi:Retrotransposon protein, Ty3-gypsy subclass [Phytophthora megakarya]|uniref:Retrotransposon protein, Ty3-gypsy subclass n=1 Tax=Phytophthora megakarya TaxID=4795 RepID=A0A225WF68_9STRA|nr:Retrotransposon protein, Ty3-gypsy subclass [Phytophthora megakarya]